MRRPVTRQEIVREALSLSNFSCEALQEAAFEQAEAGNRAATIVRAIGLQDWALAGFPTVRLQGAKYAAALVATRLHAPKSLKSPWASFFVDVPSGTFEHDIVCGALYSSVRFVLDGAAEPLDRSSLVILMRHTGPICVYGKDNIVLDDSSALDSELSRDEERHALRLVRAVTRLVANTMLAVAAERPGARAPKARRPGKLSSNPDLAEVATVYQVGRPIDIDCRPALHQFIAGRRSTTPAVRWVVRGHWRHQVHGATRAERRLQWIEPHWKGKPGAPINVRPHLLGKP